jgi:hypothetical protein
MSACELEDMITSLPVLTSEEFIGIFNYFEALTATLIKLAQASYETALKNEELVKISREMEMTSQMLTKFADSSDVAMYVQ